MVCRRLVGHLRQIKFHSTLRQKRERKPKTYFFKKKKKNETCVHKIKMSTAVKCVDNDAICAKKKFSLIFLVEDSQ